MSQKIKLAVYQMNSTVGDLTGNTDKLIYQINIAKANGADVFIAPELAISGYPPEDLLLRSDFYLRSQRELDRMLAIDGITILIGCPYRSGGENYNSLFVLRDGNILGRYDKMLLPNYGVFDECRYFTPGAEAVVFPVNGINCGVIICEDMWDTVPFTESIGQGAELVIVVNSSPFEVSKYEERLKVASYRVNENNVPLVYVNQVGGQDELIFDGASFALNNQGEKIFAMPAFEEQLAYLEYSKAGFGIVNELNNYPESTEARLYNALVLALRDYIGKNGFKGVVLGLSGGIDSALTLAIAVDALGHDKVHAVMMPSQFTADISIDDSREMVNILRVRYEEIIIGDIFAQFKRSLSPLFEGLAEDTTEENLQARIRGTLLMAISNKFGYLVVTTGNKSEMTTGYATLYGDMAGGFALLKDLPKTLVFALSNWRNTQSRVIPERIITRPPSAELRENQCDQDSLPEYPVLDAILTQLVEGKRSVEDIIQLGYPAEDVKKVAHLLKINEYKRRQAAVGPKLTTTAFARDWRYPNTNKFKF